MATSATLELTEQSTTQDVKSYVEEVVKEVKAERAGEKDDARITAEHADNEHPTKTPAENKSGEEAADAADKVTGKGEKTGEEESEADWLDDDLKAEVAAYGIEDSELAEFASREELERALRLFDKSALEAGRKAIAETDGEKATGRDEKGRFLKKESEGTKADAGATDASAKADGKFEITLDKNVFDDGIVDEFTRMRDHYEAQREQYETRLETLESRFAQADARAEEQRFDTLVDSLGHTDLFGKTDSENAKQLERRKDLHVAVKAQLIGLTQLGRPTELSESLVARVARMVFAEDLGKKDIKQRTRKISKQSDGRQGGGATRPQDAREDPRDAADRLYKELERA